MNQGQAVGNDVLVCRVIQKGGLLPFGGVKFIGGMVTPATTSSLSYKKEEDTNYVNICLTCFISYNWTAVSETFTSCSFDVRLWRTNPRGFLPVDFARGLFETVPNPKPIRVKTRWKLYECLENSSRGTLKRCLVWHVCACRKRHIWSVGSPFSAEAKNWRHDCAFSKCCRAPWLCQGKYS